MRRPDSVRHIGDAGKAVQDRAGAVHARVITPPPQLSRPTGDKGLGCIVTGRIGVRVIALSSSSNRRGRKLFQVANKAEEGIILGGKKWSSISLEFIGNKNTSRQDAKNAKFLREKTFATLRLGVKKIISDNVYYITR